MAIGLIGKKIGMTRVFLKDGTAVPATIIEIRPTISTSSPGFNTPLSTLPVTTVPRPDIVNTSSIGIRKGLSTSLCGVGIY